MRAAADHRIVGVDEHRAAGCVLADDGALRPAQNLHVGHVEIRLFLEITGEGRHAVAIGDHARRGLRIMLALADAADVEFQPLPEIIDDD